MAEHVDANDSKSQWYRHPDATCPFVLTRRITFKKLKGSPLRTVAAFPWTRDSIHLLWEGCQKIDPDAWNSMITIYEDAVATATDSCVEIYFVRKNILNSITLPPALEKVNPSPIDRVQLAWVLSPSNPYQPLLVIAHLRAIHILNVVKLASCAYLVGHGGAITSIAVHPIHPHIFATTSRDFTARIYDLRLPPRTEADVQNNPHWPSSEYPSRAGPAFGLNMDAKEGKGMGRCVIVLMGSLANQTGGGGHTAAVFGAAFHASKPLIATCGLDRAVKIWALSPTLESSRLVRIQKPVFSSISLHLTGVISIHWISEDLLLSHSAAAFLPVKTSKGSLTSDFIPTPGELILWQWLSLKRFFPPMLTIYEQPVRPTVNDWGDSSSFRIISKRSIPRSDDVSHFLTPHLNMYTLNPHRLSPGIIVLLTVPNALSTRLLHVPGVFEGDDIPKFPFFQEDSIIMNAGEQGLVQNNTKGIDSGWVINVEENAVPKLNACVMTLNGQVIVGVGTQGTLWVWTIR